MSNTKARTPDQQYILDILDVLDETVNQLPSYDTYDYPRQVIKGMISTIRKKVENGVEKEA